MIACWHWWKDCERRGRRRDGCLLVQVEGLCKERKEERWLPTGTGGRMMKGEEGGEMVVCYYWWKDCVRRGRRRGGCLLVLVEG